MHRYLSVPALILGLCVAAAATEPQLVSLNPSSGGGASQTFTLTVSDSAGAPDIGPIDLLINSTLDGSTGCWIYFNHPGQFSLYTNGQWAALASTGSTLSGSVCSVQLVSGSDSGNTSNASFAISFQPSFDGAKTIWAAAADTAGDSTGYQPMGSFTVSSTSGVPANVSVSPSNPTMYQNSPQTFTVVASDSAGATDLQGIHFLLARPNNVNDNGTDTTACWMWYRRSNNTLTMYDEGNWSAPAPLGSGGSVLTGNECTVNTSQASASASGNQLTLVVPVVPTTDFGEDIDMNAITSANSASDYQQMGYATVYPPINGQGSFTVSWEYGTPGPQGISQNKSGGAYISVTPSGGFSGPVTLSGNSQGAKSGNTSQLSFSFNPQPVEAQGNSFATITPGAAEPDMYTVSVTGTSGGQSSTTAPITVYVDNAPPTVSLAPPTHTQSGITFVLDAMDAAGFGAIYQMEFLVAPSLNGENACWIAWSDSPASSLTLANDDTSEWTFAGNTQLPGGSNGTSPAASNSQCTVSGNAAKVDYNTGTQDTNLAPTEEKWTIPITFNPSFSGTQNVYVNITNLSGLSTGYQAIGTVTTP